MRPFIQTGPRLPDAWTSDRTLRESLRFHLGEELWDEAEADLRPVGAWSTDPEVLALGMQAESEPPRLTQFGPWGDRVDTIVTSSAYEALGRAGVEFGVAALPYEDGSYGDRARLVWSAMVALWGPSSALYSCPIAMTDAAARTLLLHGAPDDIEVVKRLTSRDPEIAWTSGQWMTETTGGSDVGGTETVARRAEDGTWRLYGTKWFTSATTSQMALTLARPDGAPSGSKGLALFRIERTLPDGAPNAIAVRRLKDKLGTRSMPTAELELEGAVAYPIGDVGDGGGLRRIATMLNITRLHNSIGAAAALGRGLAFARAFASIRQVFGKPLAEQPLHQATLADLAVDYAAAVALVMRVAELTGRMERGTASDEEVALLRGLTPITKLATARWAVAGTAEAMEALGGVGYCEDSGLPALVRNTHVLPIWEGTTNVLALDLLRSAARSDSLSVLLRDARAALVPIRDHPAVGGTCVLVAQALDDIECRAAATKGDQQAAEAGARSLAFSVATTYACTRLCLQGAWAADRGDQRTAQIAKRLAQRGLLTPPPPVLPQNHPPYE
ncbi:MAG: acyl-CoA dehydrogenase family protein [Actinomycetota bacterium]